MNIENNKIIAEFMGFDFSRFDNDGIIEPQEDIFFTDSKTFTPEELKFHSDWNWLMEVVAKLKTVGYLVHFNLQLIGCEISVIDIDGNILFEVFTKINTQEKTMLSVTYNACVEFVKWLNEQKS